MFLTFTFMHLEDAFIQSDLHCIQVTVFTFSSSQYQVRKFGTCVLGNSEFSVLDNISQFASATAIFLTVFYNRMKYDIKHLCLFSFLFKHINIAAEM